VIEIFLDTPVKRYSSVMYVRLAFAVAAHLEPEILVVDEVLAVGDAEFQQKCLGRMGQVSKEGRTVLFVSHNIGALRTVCESGLVLDAGRAVYRGPIEEAAEAYRTRTADAAVTLNGRVFEGPLRAVSFQEVLINGRGLAGNQCVLGDKDLTIAIRGHTVEHLEDFRISIGLSWRGQRILTMHDGPEALRRGWLETIFTVPGTVLRPGEYGLTVGGRRTVDILENWIAAFDFASIEVLPRWGADYQHDDDGVVNLVGGRMRTHNGSPKAAAISGLDHENGSIGHVSGAKTPG
jgi:lipopolysaccharide transport system ATP-binding protein